MTNGGGVVILLFGIPPSLPPPPHSSPPAPDYPSNVMGAEKFVNPFLSFPSTIKTTAATTATVRRNDIGQWTTGVGEPMPIKWIFLCVSKIESKQYDRVSLNWEDTYFHQNANLK